MGLLNPGRVKLTLPERIINKWNVGVVCCFLIFNFDSFFFFKVADRAMASPNYSCSESKRLAAKLLVWEPGRLTTQHLQKEAIFMQHLH